VKIIYANGTVSEAVLLSCEGSTLRAAVSGEDDVRELTRIDTGWITEEWEPVTVEFEWQRILPAEVPSEGDCICPPELASSLKKKLIGVPAEDDAPEPDLYVFAADGTRTRIRRNQLLIH
jgi:hypothetical protein